MITYRGADGIASTPRSTNRCPRYFVKSFRSMPSRRSHQVELAAGLIEALTGVATFYVTEPIDEVPGVISGTSYRFQLDVIAKF